MPPGDPDAIPSRNELGSESSPYLIQHATQPVHWLAWGERALRAAERSQRPIMLSIGYAACHWCHVMAHESFDDPEIAGLLNDLFIAIKVDREERPDIDRLYMAALQSMGEQGGWPLTMFLTPGGVPFWGGTYFPPEPRWGRPAFRQVLHAVASAFGERDGAIARNAGLVAGAIRASAASAPGGMPGPGQIEQAASHLLSMSDDRHGGFAGAPKFPNFPAYRFLAQRAARGGAPAFAAVRRLLQAICDGGIFDHAGGGMFRYSTDQVWLVPHFEKMLYDNAQLLEALALACAARADERFRAAACATAGFLIRDLGVDCAFGSSLDADSEGGEGAFYVWTAAEIDAALGERSAAFKDAFGVEPRGNWEGRSILHWNGRAAARTQFVEDLATLQRVRAARPRPPMDDKVLTDWNGLAIVALCRAAHVFEMPEWRAAAERCFQWLQAHLVFGGRWHHAWRAGKLSARALIDDLAAAGLAALALYQATGASAYLDAATKIAGEAETFFGPAGIGYAMTASDAPDLPAGLKTRPVSNTCGAVPSGSGMMAELLARLFHLSGDPKYRGRAVSVIEAFAGGFSRPLGHVTLLAAAELLEDGLTVVVAGAPALPATGRLLQIALAAPDPAICVLRQTPESLLPSGHPAHGKLARPGTAAAFICRGGVCQAPIEDPAVLRAALSGAIPA